CSVLKRLFFMSVLVVDGLYSFTWYGSAGAGQSKNRLNRNEKDTGKVIYFPSFADPVDFSKRKRPEGVSEEAHQAFIRGATFYQMLSIQERKSFK
ncbi:hypothetical protein, partial [Xanthomonas campestris]